MGKPSDGGAKAPPKQSKSERTRERILTTARRQFARDGYERTTIRSVAAEAEIDPSMVMRYFGSKDGLFAAVADFDLHLPDLAAVPADERGTHLARHFLKVWRGSETGFNGFAILLRTSATNPAAVERVASIVATQVAPRIAAIADHPQERAAIATAHVFGFAFSRFLLGLPAMLALPDEVVVTHLGQALQSALDSRLRPPGE
jgi:AcrR family transcriptional regulator